MQIRRFSRLFAPSSDATLVRPGVRWRAAFKVGLGVALGLGPNLGLNLGCDKQASHSPEPSVATPSASGQSDAKLTPSPTDSAPEILRENKARTRPKAALVEDRATALKAVTRGNPEGARDFLDAALGKAPKDEELRLALARALMVLGDYASAQKVLSDKSGTPGSAARVLMRAELLVTRGQPSKAVEALEAARKDHPADLPLQGALVQIFAHTGQAKSPRAQALMNALYDAYESGKAKSAEQLLAVAHAALGRGTKGAFHDANTVFDEAEAASNQTPDAPVFDRILKTRAHMFLEKYAAEEAITTFELILHRDSWDPDALAGSARVYVDSLQFGPASRSATEALQVNPHHAQAHAVLARVALIEGRREEARERITKHVLSVNPVHTEGLAVLAGLAIAEFDTKGYAHSRDAAMSLNAKGGSFYKDLADILGFLHLYPEADEILREGALRDPENPYIHAARGLNLLRLGDEITGRKELKLAWKKDPFNERTRNTLDLYDRLEPEDPDVDRTYSVKQVGSLTVRLPDVDREFIEPVLTRSVRWSAGELDTAYHTTSKNLRLEFFADPQDFSIRTVGVPSLGAVAVCFGPVITFIGPYQGVFNIENIIRHELSHTYAIKLSRGRVPRWFTEGLSEWESELADPAWARESAALLLSARRANKLRKLAELELAFIRAESPQMMEVAYSTAAYAVRYLGTTYGRDKLIEILKGYGRGEHTDALFKLNFGKDLATVEGEFETWFFAQLDAKVTGWSPARSQDKADKRDKLFASASTQLEGGDLPGAMHQLESLITTKGGDGFAPRMLLARLLMKSAKPAAATRHLEAARKFHQESVEPLVLLAQLARDSGRAVAEAKHLRAALAIDGDSFEPAARLVMLGLVGSDAQATRVGLRRAEGIAPLHPLALAARALQTSNKAHAKRLTERAVKALQRVEGGPADTLVVVALAAHAIGDKATAAKLATAAIKLGKLPSAATKRLQQLVK